MTADFDNYPAATAQHQLYFDGRCSLCAKEMALLNRLKNRSLALVDIHAMTSVDEDIKETLLRSLHLQQPDGTWIRGVDANVMAWSFTPIGFLWRPLRWPCWRAQVDSIYTRWASKRYCANYACARNS